MPLVTLFSELQCLLVFSLREHTTTMKYTVDIILNILFREILVNWKFPLETPSNWFRSTDSTGLLKIVYSLNISPAIDVKYIGVLDVCKLFNIINCQSYNIYLNCKNYYSSFTINKIFLNQTNLFGKLIYYNIIYSVITDINSPTRFSAVSSGLNLLISRVRVLRVSIFPKRICLMLL